MTAFRITLSCLIGLATTGNASAADQPGDVASPFRFEPVDDRSLKLSDGERPVLVYNHGEISNPDAPTAKPRGSYVHPIYGIDGEVLTDDFPKDHVNHRGLYWSWPHVASGERQLDSWNVRDLKTRFLRWTAREARADGATLAVENGWFAGEKQVARETARFEVHPIQDGARAIDVTLEITPIDQPLTLRGAEGKGYGGLAIRFAPRTTTIVTTPGGIANADLLTADLPWADFTGDLAGKDRLLSGIALFVPPAHRDPKPQWMTRAYGMLAPGWPGVQPQTIPPGQTVTLTYRLWIHRGNADAAKLQREYDIYTARSTTSTTKGAK